MARSSVWEGLAYRPLEAPGRDAGTLLAFVGAWAPPADVVEWGLGAGHVRHPCAPTGRRGLVADFRVAKALFLAAPAEETPAPQPWFAGLLAGLGVLTIVGGLWNDPLQAWSEAGQKSLGIGQEPASK